MSVALISNKPYVSQMSGIKYLALGAFLAAFGGAIVWTINQPAPDPDDALRLACREGIQGDLHDPERADWSGLPDWVVNRTGTREATVDMRFRAPNAFGGIVLQRYRCTVFQSGNRWAVWSLETM